MQKSVNMKREKVENCEICGSKFSTFKGQHQCKRCLRAVCGDCSKDKALVLKTAQVDKEKHRLCNICKADAINQKKIRDEQKLKFATDSPYSKRWLEFLSNVSLTEINQTYERAQKPPETDEHKKMVVLDMREFNSTYEQQRSGFNNSWFDMIYFLTEKIEKKDQQETVRRVIQAFLNTNPTVGFFPGMIDLVFYILAYCSEAVTFFIFSFMYRQILPEFMQPKTFKQQAAAIDDDIKFIEEILQTNYKIGPKDMASCSTVLHENYISMAQGFLSNWLVWESYIVFLETVIQEQNYYAVQNCIALMCYLSIKQITLSTDTASVQHSMVKQTNSMRVREFLQQQQNDRMKSVSQSRMSRVSRSETVEDRLRQLERENKSLKQALSGQKDPSVLATKRTYRFDEEEEEQQPSEQKDTPDPLQESQAKLAQTLADFKVMQRHCEDLTRQNAEYIREIEHLKARTVEIDQQSQEQDQEIKNVYQEQIALKGKLKEQGAAVLQLTSANEALKKTISELEINISQSKLQSTAIEEENDKLKLSIKQLEENSGIKDQLAAKVLEGVAIAKEIESLKKIHKEQEWKYKTENQKLQDDLDASTTKGQELTAQMAMLTAELTRMGQQLALESQAKQTAIQQIELRSQAGSELNESLQAAKAHVEAQNKELEAARLQIEQLKNEQSLQKTSFENEILRLNQQLKNEQSEADAKLKASNDESQLKQQALVDSTKLELDKLSTEKSDIQLKLLRVTEELSTIQSQFAASRSELQTQQQSQVDVQAAFRQREESMQSTLETKSLQITELNNSNAKLQQELQEAQQRVIRLNSEKEEMSLSASAGSSELEHRLRVERDANEDLRKQIEVARNLYLAMEASHQTEKSSLLEASNQQIESLAQANADLQQLNEQIAQLNRDLVSAQTERAHAKTKNESLELEVQQVKHDLSKQAAAFALEQTFTKETHALEVTVLEQRIEAQRNEHQHEIVSLNTELSKQHDTHISELELQLSKFKVAHSEEIELLNQQHKDVLSQQLEAHQIQIQQINTANNLQIDSLNEKIGVLTLSSNDLQDKLRNENIRLTATIEQLGHQVETQVQALEQTQSKMGDELLAERALLLKAEKVNAQLEQDLEAFKSQSATTIKQKDDEFARVKDELDQSQTMHKLVESEFLAERILLNKTQTANTQLQQELDTSKTQSAATVNKQEHDLAGIKTELETSHTKHKLVESELSQAQSTNAQLVKDLDNFKSQSIMTINERDDELANIKAELDISQAKRKEIESELLAERALVLKAQTDNAQLDQAIEAVKSESAKTIKQQEHELARIQTDLDILQTKHKEVESDLLAERALIIKAHTSNAELTKEIDALKSQSTTTINQKEYDLTQIKTDLAIQQTKHKLVEDELLAERALVLKIQTANAQLEQAFDTFKSQSAVTIQQHQDELARINVELATLQKTHNQVESELVADRAHLLLTQTANAQLKEDLNALKSQSAVTIKSKEDDLTRVNVELDTLQTKQKQVESDLLAERALLLKAQTNNVELLKDLDALKQQSAVTIKQQQDDLAIIKAEFSTLQTMHKQLESELQDERANLFQTQTTNAQLVKDLETFKAESAATIKQQEDELVGNKAELDKLQTKCSQVESELLTEQTNLTHHQTTNAQLQQDLDALKLKSAVTIKQQEDELALINAQLNTSQTKHNQVESQLVAERTNLLKAQTANAQLQNDLEAFKSQQSVTNKQHQDDLAHIQVELNTSQSKHKQLESELLAERALLLKAQTDNDDLAKDLDAVKSQSAVTINQRDNELGSVNAELANTQSKHKQVESELLAERALLLKAQTTNTQIAQDFEIFKSQSTTGIKQRDDDLATIKAELANAHVKDRQLQSQLSELQAKIERVQAEKAETMLLVSEGTSEFEQRISAERDRVEALRREVVTREDEIAVLQGTISSDKATIVTLKDDITRLSVEQQRLQTQLTQATQRIEEDTENRRELNAKLDKAEETSQSLQQSLQTQSQQIEQLQTKLNDSQTREQRLQKQIQELTIENSGLAINLQQSQDASNQQNQTFNSERANLEQSIVEIGKQLKDVTESSQSRITELENKIGTQTSDSQTQISELQGKLALSIKQLEEQQSAVFQTKIESEQMATRQREETKAAQLASATAVLELENKLMQSQKELNKLQDELEQKHNAHEAAVLHYETQLMQLRKQEGELSQDLIRLNQQLDQSNQELLLRDDQLDQGNQDSHRQNDQLVHAQQDLDRINGHLEQSRQAWLQEKTQLEQQQTQLEQSLKDQRQQLIDQHAQYDREIISLNAELAQSKQEMLMVKASSDQQRQELIRLTDELERENQELLLQGEQQKVQAAQSSDEIARLTGIVSKQTASTATQAEQLKLLGDEVQGLNEINAKQQHRESELLAEMAQLKSESSHSIQQLELVLRESEERFKQANAQARSELKAAIAQQGIAEAALRAEVQELQQALDTKTRLLHEASDELQVERARTQRLQAEKEETMLTASVGSLDFESRIRTERDKVESLTKQVVLLQHQVQDQQSTIQRENEIHSRRVSELTALAAESTATLEERVLQSQSELKACSAKYESQLKDSEDRLINLKQEAESIRARDLEALRLEHKGQVELELKQREDQIAELRQELKVVQEVAATSLRNHQSELATLQDLLTSTKVELEQATATHATELMASNNAAKQLQHDLEVLTTDFSEFKQKSVKALEASEAQNQALGKLHQDSQAEAEHQRKTLEAALANESEQLREDRDQLSTSQSRLLAELSQVRSQMELLELTLNSAHQKELQDRDAAATREIDRLSGELASLKQHAEMGEVASVAALEGEKRQLKQEAILLTAQVAELVAQLRANEKQLALVENECHNKDSTIGQLETTLQVERSEKRKSEGEALQTLQQSNTDLQNQLNAARTSLAPLQQQHHEIEELKSELALAHQALKHASQEYTGNLAAQTATIAELQRKLESAPQVQEGSEDVRLNAEIEHLQQQIAALTGQKTSFDQVSHEEVEALRKEVLRQSEINRVLIDRMTKMNMDIVEQIQFVRSYKPETSEIEAINNVLNNIDPQGGPLLQSIHAILDNLRFEQSKRKPSLDYTKQTTMAQTQGDKKVCSIF